MAVFKSSTERSSANDKKVIPPIGFYEHILVKPEKKLPTNIVKK